jgi:hypothetical protein
MLARPRIAVPPRILAQPRIPAPLKILVQQKNINLSELNSPFFEGKAG